MCFAAVKINQGLSVQDDADNPKTILTTPDLNIFKYEGYGHLVPGQEFLGFVENATTVTSTPQDLHLLLDFRRPGTVITFVHVNYFTVKKRNNLIKETNLIIFFLI